MMGGFLCGSDHTIMEFNRFILHLYISNAKKKLILKKKKTYLQNALRDPSWVVILLNSIKSIRSLRLELTHLEKALPSNWRQATIQFLWVTFCFRRRPGRLLSTRTFSPISLAWLWNTKKPTRHAQRCLLGTADKHGIGMNQLRGHVGSVRGLDFKVPALYCGISDLCYVITMSREVMSCERWWSVSLLVFNKMIVCLRSKR